jgi:pimeloyl-ACP methyl ester carboxylesterase
MTRNLEQILPRKNTYRYVILFLPISRTCMHMAGAMEAGIPRARRVAVKDAGHIMYLEKPAEFSRLVIGFIEQNSDGR